MTTEKTRTPRNSKPLSVGKGIDKIAALRSTRAARRNAHMEAFDVAEHAEEQKTRDRIDAGDLQVFDHMMKSLPSGYEEVMFDAEDEEASSSDADELPAGAREYSPGPAARAARGTR